MPIELVLPPPQPKQQLFMMDRHKYVLFGGSRGGGKSFAVDEKSILSSLKFKDFKCTILRRTYPELRDNHIEPMKRMLKCGTQDAVAKFNNSDKEMLFKNGSKIRFRYCDNENALPKLQGQETDFLFIDEATNIPEVWLKKLYACVRGTNSYPKRIFLTCNPGGVSHGYIRRLKEGHFEIGEKPEEYSFIQSSVFDNKALMDANPDYVSQLEALPPKIRDAWLYGRWDTFEGAYFEEFRETPDIEQCVKHNISVEQAQLERRWTHVIEPFDIPSDWKIYRGYDWGYGKPFAFVWMAQPPGSDVLYQFLEFYGCTGTPNEGVKWTNAQQFDYVKELENTHPWLKGRRIQGVADPSIWDKSHGPSAAEEADKHQLWFEPGNNNRIQGWMQVRERMKFDANGKAEYYIFNTCKHTIRTFPLMMFDDTKVEDLDTELEDHILDSVRYLMMMRPIAPRKIETELKPMVDPLNQFKKQNGVWTPYYSI